MPLYDFLKLYGTYQNLKTWYFGYHSCALVLHQSISWARMQGATGGPIGHVGALISITGRNRNADSIQREKFVRVFRGSLILLLFELCIKNKNLLVDRQISAMRDRPTARQTHGFR